MHQAVMTFEYLQYNQLYYVVVIRQIRIILLLKYTILNDK